MSRRRTRLSFVKRYKPYIVSVVLGAFSGVVLILLFSLAMFLFQLPTDWAGILSLVALCASALISGFVLGKYKRKNGIALGAKVALILFLLCLIGAIICQNVTGGAVFSKLICLLAGGITGSVCGVNSKSRI